MIKQRDTKNLGLNRSKDRPEIYDYIEHVLKIKKKWCCCGGKTKNKGKYNFAHEGPNPLPIREFSLMGAYIDSSGKVIITSKDGLQSYCITCERKYRRGRLNRWHNKYSKLSDVQIYEEYKINYGKTSHCSRCGQNKLPEEFAISRNMDKGLHNVCKSCSKDYTESVGNRWAIFSPDGHESITIKYSDCCINCNSKIKLHKDHIWPIAKGGTDNQENLQVLCRKCNLSKSDSIIGINSITELDKKMICERYWDLLDIAKKENWAINKFEQKITNRVRKFILSKQKLTDDELREFFENEKIRNNRKHSIDRAVRKFREYSQKAILDISEYISKTQ